MIESHTATLASFDLKILNFQSLTRPFGMEHKVYVNPGVLDFKTNTDSGNGTIITNVLKTDYLYKFNGKEYQDKLGLNWYSYGFRMYDPALGRFPSVDPMAEKFPGWSPYNYTLQNPVRYIDPDGKAPLDIIYLNKNGSINRVVKDGKVHITIVDTDGKNYSLSSYHIDKGLIYWNNRNRQVVANVAGYYGKQVGVSGIGATYKKVESHIIILPTKEFGYLH